MNMNQKQNIQVGDWTIEPDGTMVHESPAYDIEGTRLTDTNWIAHMAQKNWVNMRIFVRAYFMACQVRGIRTVTVKTNFV